MNKSIKDAIYNICPSPLLKEALCLNDFESAIDILQKTFDIFDTFSSEYAIFDSLYQGIIDNNPRVIKSMIIICEKLFFLDVASKVVEFSGLIKDGIEVDFVCENSEEYFRGIKHLNEFASINTINYDDFINKLMSCKNKKYQQVEALDRVLTMPILGYDVDKILASYIEALIHGNEITFYDVMCAILDNDPDILMEKIKVMEYLRELYYDLVITKTNILESQIKEFLAPGLQRKKPN